MYGLRILLSSLVAFLLATSSVALLPSKEYEEHLEKGRELLRLKQYEEAIVELEKAESLAPGQHLAALTSLERAYEETNRPGEAIRAWRGFVESATDPELSARAYNALGIWLLRRSDEDVHSLAESEQAFRKVLELSRGKAHRARLNLAETLYRAGDEREALAVLEEYPAYVPAESLMFLRLGPVSDRVFDQLTQLLLAKDPDNPVYYQGSVEKPEKVSAVQPLYTKVAHEHGTQGRVILRTVIDKTGHVQDVEVLKGLLHGLTEQAVQAVRQWKFKPATFRGEPVAVYYNVTVNFRLAPKEEELAGGRR